MSAPICYFKNTSAVDAVQAQIQLKADDAPTKQAIASKANQTALDSVSATVATKADQVAVDASLALKHNEADSVARIAEEKKFYDNKFGSFVLWFVAGLVLVGLFLR